MHKQTPLGAITPAFAKRQHFGAGLKPVDLVATDIDGDGRVDSGRRSRSTALSRS